MHRDLIRDRTRADKRLLDVHAFCHVLAVDPAGEWVVVYFYDDDHVEGQHTVVTETARARIAEFLIRINAAVTQSIKIPR